MEGKGIIACEGIGIGQALVFIQEDINVVKRNIEDINVELDKFNKAISESVVELGEVYAQALVNLGKEEADIFNAHKMICEDIEIIGATNNLITDEQVCCEFAYESTMNTFIAMFQAMDDEYMQERALDLEDVKKRVLRNILNIKTVDLTQITEDTIVIAKDLTPSETSQLNSYVKGFVTMLGGKTSHSAIIARSLQLPSIVGLNEDLSKFDGAQTIIIDAIKNNIIINPSADQLDCYQQIQANYDNERKLWNKQIGKQSVLPSGKNITIAANVATLSDLEDAIKIKANGIGLLRTEFLYMETKELPSEEKQYQFYKQALDAFPNEKVVIRTLDIGGDKNHEYFDLGEELNPFLGVRAIRLCFEYLDVFKTQIKALLKANTHGNLCIMFPMIATIEEFLKAKEIVKTCHQELVNENFEICEQYQLGTMVEIPAVAIIASEFAKHVDFFSIGTNDLIQYTMASDRMNQKLNYLYQPMNNAITTLIKNVVTAGHEANKWVGMCGEMASDSDALEFLVDLEIDELSMNTKSILRTKHNIEKLLGA